MKRFVRIKNRIIDIDEIKSIKISDVGRREVIFAGEMHYEPVYVKIEVYLQNTVVINASYDQDEIEYLYELIYNIYLDSFEGGDELTKSIKDITDKMIDDAPYTIVEPYRDELDDAEL